jgi:trimeric autotransporter adhesin
VAALQTNTTGAENIAVGFLAGSNLTTGNFNIDIGSQGVTGDSSTIRIGSGSHTRTFIAGISGVGVTGTAIVVDGNGQLGVAASSHRFKTQIKPMDRASEAIQALKPVTFRYKKEIDAEGAPQFGLVAEEVEKVNPALVARDADGKAYTVRYDAVNAMLLNEFLKEHRKNEEQEATITRLQKQIEELTVGLQKVSAQLELSKAAPQTVLNNQ